MTAVYAGGQAETVDGRRIVVLEISHAGAAAPLPGPTACFLNRQAVRQRL
jgi:hypothetical protein